MKFKKTAMLLVDAPIWLLLVNPSPEKVVPIKILSFFSDAFFCAIISLYAYCLTEYISERKKISYRYTNVITAFCGIALVLWFINIFNVRYSWGISRILNQNSVNSEFVKWRPRISLPPLFAFFMWDYFPLQGNITIFANITQKILSFRSHFIYLNNRYFF